ncbi:Trk K+ transport system NAD-binding subunit [Asanoa ferruginea]|uniref:Trk K+ transport system NAD-binding subunit n=1 Tax=Asanoa ferruginea TaxID=53367 RepID=A0A3D9ZSN4_9ACTN|nr:NAD-binding protein [Asanoa ferruginea]REF96670.1 Trk K+ transport system NAD-binding subunit [Asanoa ferruginea]GIF48947.1 potassium transporter TrkA [Asanoa ferruginea]
MVVPWRNRARRAVETRLRDGLRTNGDTRPHYIVCGHDALAYHLVNALGPATVRVTVVLPPGRHPTAPDIAKIRGIRVIRADRVDETTLRAAGLETAAGLALMQQDDVGNIHAALTAHEVAPRVRVVMRMFNTGLGYGVKRLLGDCEVLSDAAMAAPTFVAAALGEVAPTNFHHYGRTLIVAHREDVRPEHVVCGIADTSDPAHMVMLPDPARADLVLAEATGQQPATEVAANRIARARRIRRPLRGFGRALSSFLSRKIGIATAAVLLVAVTFGYLLYRTDGTAHLDPWQAVYTTLLTALNGADVEVDKGVVVQLMQIVLTVAGLALVPLITAAVVDAMVKARLALSAGRLAVPREDHVVVVGLGNVGTRVIRQLHNLGVEVVAIDKVTDPRGAVVAKQLGIPVIVGDAALEETLVEASVGTCRALVVVSTDDVTNLQAALNGRALQPDLRVVLRLFDGDLAQRIRSTFSIFRSHSVSYLAAPAFAAVLRKRQVVATIPVGRHALLVTIVVVAKGSALDGQPVRAADHPRGARVIALLKAGQRPGWSPPPDTLLGPGDELTVVARRAGLSALIKQASPPQVVVPVQPGPDSTSD